MEEQIKKMIQENSKGVDVTFINGAHCVGSATDIEELACNIAAHFTKFIEWKDAECSYDGTDQTYYLPDIQKWISLNDLYHYWLTNIKK